MRLLGKVVHSVKSGYIVVALEQSKPPRLGAPVYTDDRRRVGVVLDVIGPVDSPYAVVKPDKLEYIDAVKPGDKLYYEVPRTRKRRGKVQKRGRRGRG